MGMLEPCRGDWAYLEWQYDVGFRLAGTGRAPCVDFSWLSSDLHRSWRYSEHSRVLVKVEVEVSGILY